MTKPLQGRQPWRHARSLLAALLLAAAGGCALLPRSALEDEAAIRAVLARQLADWNAGDIDGFLRAYLQSGRTRFASGDSSGRGWAAARARYHARFPRPDAMGQLAFGEVEIESLGRDYALASGRWRLQRDDRTEHGVFTFVLVRTVDGWKIAHDHTSAGAAPPTD
jgi:beta-aspartyl-peptidase (threonine type)